MTNKRESKFMGTKKAILEALEDKPKYPLLSLVGGFMAIVIGSMVLNKMVNKYGGLKLI